MHRADFRFDDLFAAIANCFILTKLEDSHKNKSVALQLRRATTDWSGGCWMTVQGALWLAKRLSLNLNFSFLIRICYFSYQIATQLSSRGWVDPVPDPILPEKILGYSRESTPGPLGWQSDEPLYQTDGRTLLRRLELLNYRKKCGGIEVATGAIV